jgi:hypothetical protein
MFETLYLYTPSAQDFYTDSQGVDRYLASGKSVEEIQDGGTPSLLGTAAIFALLAVPSVRGMGDLPAQPFRSLTDAAANVLDDFHVGFQRSRRIFAFPRDTSLRRHGRSD